VLGLEITIWSDLRHILVHLLGFFIFQIHVLEMLLNGVCICVCIQSIRTGFL
jgi:hypothetical protein